MRTAIALALASAAIALPTRARAQDRTTAVSQFRIQEIDKTLKVGYGVRIVDLDRDGKPDIVVADSARVIWFENPGKTGAANAPWKLHTIIEDAKAGVKSDNVCIDVYDIDHDGKLDIALGADWQPGNTNAGGSLQWLQQGTKIDEPWTVRPIAAPIPTLHRINFCDIDGDGKAELLVGPLKGKGSTQQKDFMDVGTAFTAYAIPADPTKDKWEPRVLTDALHVMHNFLPVAGRRADEFDLFLASNEGVSLLRPKSGQSGSLELLAGVYTAPPDDGKPVASRGAGEIRRGTVCGQRAFATIEPFHGNQVVVYAPPNVGGGAWTRTVLDDTLKEGHALWMADLDGDGSDEIIAGWHAGKPTGLRVYQASPAADKPAMLTWQKHDLDLGGVAVEDLACADLDGDGKIDIVAVGRATGNVRIYWNEGKPVK